MKSRHKSYVSIKTKSAPFMVILSTQIRSNKYGEQDHNMLGFVEKSLLFVYNTFKTIVGTPQKGRIFRCAMTKMYILFRKKRTKKLDVTSVYLQ